MAIPDHGTPEGASAESIIEKRLKDLAYFASRKLGVDSSRFHILFLDSETGQKVASFATSQRNGDYDTSILFESTAILPSQETVLDAVDILRQTSPGTPMICDENVLNELRGDTLQKIDGGHYQLIGHPNGDLDIYCQPVASV